MGLITIAEAAASLNEDVFPEWEALDDPFKQRHIDRMSAYIRLTWTDNTTGFSWDTDTTWVAGTKDVLAEYADADRASLIYGDGTAGQESTSPIKKTKEKIGSLETEIEYAQPDIQKRSLGLSSLDDRLLALGFTKVSKRGSLTRV